MSRTKRLTNDSDGRYFKLQLVVDGGIVIAQDGRETEITAGDFTIVDCTRPYSLSAHGRCTSWSACCPTTRWPSAPSA